MSHADRRSVATDALETLGTIITENEKRDAIHLAVEPVIAAHDLLPGQNVGFIQGGVGVSDNPVGIVDPFLKRPVNRGERFWLVVYPRQITSLRHVWEHPSFPASGETGSFPPASEATIQATPAAISQVHPSMTWLMDFADEVGISYGELMAGAGNYIYNDEYLCLGELLEGKSVPDQFWFHYQVITGVAVPESEQDDFFSCSC
jgi:hypothetical protein